jgi:5-methylcytosine-specific restriction enzyme subunit McrC
VPDDPVVLHEWRWTATALPRSVVDELQMQHRHLDVRPYPGTGMWELRPTNTVGTIVVGDHQLIIKPKVPIPNLLAMMDVPITSELIRPDDIRIAGHEDLHRAVIRLLCSAAELIVARGLRHDYRTHDELLIAPRGRIDMRQLIRRNGLAIPVPCTFDDHTADIPLNGLLRGAIDRCMRTPGLDRPLVRRLRLVQAALDGIDPRTDTSWLDTWMPTRMDRHYRAAIRLARWVLDGGSPDIAAGSEMSTAFVIDMDKLFERFVADELQRTLPDLDVVEQSRVFLGHPKAVPMKPDIVLKDRSETVAVADCKYKVLDDPYARAPDYYQVLAYATALNLDEAWLLYVRGPGDPDLEEVAVRNTDIRLRTAAVGLTDPIDAVRDGLARIGSTMRPRVTAVGRG